MANNNNDALTGRTPKEAKPSGGKKQSRMLWIVILAFMIFIASVFLTENKGDQTDWWNKDYYAGIELAKQKHKPALICFFKRGTRFSSDMWQGVYNKPVVRKYVQANFVPILIDVDKQPEIAKRYNITYYPTHYIENPNTNQTEGPHLGAGGLFEFIKKYRDRTKP